MVGGARLVSLSVFCSVEAECLDGEETKAMGAVSIAGEGEALPAINIDACPIAAKAYTGH
jgi:hypothetical protein